MKQRSKPRWVTCRKNRDGTERWYWQKRGERPIRLSDDPVEREAKARELNGDDEPVGEPHIYVIRAGLQGPFKIGFSGSKAGIWPRLFSLQTAHYRELHLIGSTPGTMTQEREIHRALREFRLMGEWFDPLRPVREYVATLLTSGVERALEIRIEPLPLAEERAA